MTSTQGKEAKPRHRPAAPMTAAVARLDGIRQTFQAVADVQGTLGDCLQDESIAALAASLKLPRLLVRMLCDQAVDGGIEPRDLFELLAYFESAGVSLDWLKSWQ